MHISYERHHRHSYYLIKHGDLRGFEPHEIEAIALIARYHRQAQPEKSHEGFERPAGGRRACPSRALRDGTPGRGLDRSHAQALAGIDLYPRRD